MRKVLLNVILILVSTTALADSQIHGEWVRYTSVCSYDGFENIFPLNDNQIANLYPGIRLNFFIEGRFRLSTSQQRDCLPGESLPCFNEGNVEFFEDNAITLNATHDKLKAGWGSTFKDWTYKVEGSYLFMRPTGISMNICPGTDMIIIFEKVENSILISQLNNSLI